MQVRSIAHLEETKNVRQLLRQRPDLDVSLKNIQPSSSAHVMTAGDKWVKSPNDSRDDRRTQMG
jgi:hypothetical protein